MGGINDNKDSSTPRRAPPNPNVSPQSKASAINETPVPPASFYSNSKPPPLPSRPIGTSAGPGPGSANTRYRPPTSPPPYLRGNSTPFREPELISEEPISDDEPLPALIDVTHPQQQSAWYEGSTPWDHRWSDTSNWGSGKPWADETIDPAWASDAYHNPLDWSMGSASQKVPIDGTDDEEEKNWWDPAVRHKHKRPGPGVLAPVLEELLHHSEHSLFSVQVTTDFTRSEAISGSNKGHSPSASIDRSRSSQSMSSSPQPSSSSSSPVSVPSADELINAVPHPNAYYCRRHNGWVILQWKQSTFLPPLVKSFRERMDHPLPNPALRKKRQSCIDTEPSYGEEGNKTHHFHVYEKAVSAHKLTPPFHRRPWEMVDKVKQKRRRMTTLNMDELNMDASGDLKMAEEIIADEETEGDLLDLYICCQCSLYCVASEVIPGVIPLKYVEEFNRWKLDNPCIDKNGQESVVIGWETLLTVLENKLWKGENRTLPIGRRAFQRKMGWNPNVQHIFETLGYRLAESPDDKETGPVLSSPITTSATVEGKQNRARLLRAWVEIGAWLTDYMKRFAPALKAHIPQPLHVSLLPAREMYQSAIGAHINQMPRGGLSNTLLQYEPISRAWKVLGLTPTAYSPELLVFAYMAQCRCDPANTIEYFSWFYSIVEAMQELRQDAGDLQRVVIEERARNRFTHQDLQKAAVCLGFGKDEPICLEFDDDIDEEFITRAWRDKVCRAWRDPKDGAELQRDANEAFRILAEVRGSVKLRQLWEESQGRTMNPDRAYSTIEIPKEVDDGMLLTVFSLRVEEQPSQGDKMREALTIIAEVRDSARLRGFLETGTDPGDVTTLTRSDLPRGLNQLGNTCYLNSLLQYFYTIKELREAVAPMANLDEKFLEDEKVSDDALKQHRVGGRLVTRREVGRSKKFVTQLANLFWQLEHLQTAAITPTVELAKLALVTSRDEEEDEVDRGGTDSSNDTDATLVEDAPTRVSATEQSSHSPVRSGTVLGKRLRDDPQQRGEMDVDSPKPDSERDKDGFVLVSSPTSPLRSSTPQSPGEGSSSKASKSGEAVDVEMQDNLPQTVQKAPPLPPRKNTISDSVMMFGKQHDVSECMDNCMFQIETALLKFDGLNDLQEGKDSIVKRLFYGKIRQRLAAVSQDSKSRSSVHEKEDLFSHLPVNVAEDGFDLYDGLSGYFDDVVDFEGKKARMEVSLVDLPPLLQVQLQRVQFNRETLQPYKSQAYVKFGEKIYMDRFLDAADPSKKSRSKAIQADLNSCRERINILTHGKHAPFAAALESTLNFLSKQEEALSSDLGEDVVAQLNEEQALVKVEIDDLRSRVVRLKEDLESLWLTETNAPYELTSVFVHRGSSPSWGHYFFYSRNLPDHPDSWFKYNDSNVSEVSKDEVLADTTGSTANPYLLVFARKGSEVIQTVKRSEPDQIEADT